MYFLFSLLRIKGLNMFRTLLAYPENVLAQMALDVLRAVSWLHQDGAADWHNMQAMYQVSFVPARPEDKQVIFETYRGP
jgi:hypothetical protein